MKRARRLCNGLLVNRRPSSRLRARVKRAAVLCSLLGGHSIAAYASNAVVAAEIDSSTTPAVSQTSSSQAATNVSTVLGALRINGWPVSDGLVFRLTAEGCAVPLDAVREQVQVTRLTQQDGHVLFTRQAHGCRFDDGSGTLDLQLPADLLQASNLTLAKEIPADVETPVRAIAALALDAYVARDTRLFNLVASNEETVARAANLTAKQANERRYVLDHLRPNGMQVVAGDFRAERAVVSTLRDFRGLYFTSKAEPLRAQGNVAEALVSVTAPARAYFINETGQRVGETGLLAPGNYRLQGTPASTFPGQLEAVIVDQSGRENRVLLPWARDRRLLPQGSHLVDAYLGRRRDGVKLDPDPAGAVNWRYGLNSTETTQLTAEHGDQGGLVAAELTTRRYMHALLTAGAAVSCRDGCRTGYLMQGRWRPLARGYVNALWSAWPDGQAAQAPMHTGQVGITLDVLNNTSTSLAFARTVQEGRRSTQAIAAGQLRINDSASVVAQVRRSVDSNAQLGMMQNGPTGPMAMSGFNGSNVQWTGFIGVVIALTSKSGSLSVMPSINRDSSSTHPSFNFSASQAQPYGPQLSGSARGSGWGHNNDPMARSSSVLFGRYLSPYGEGFAQSTDPGRDSAGFASRLWLADGAVRLAPHGDGNLILASTGIPGVSMRGYGTDATQADDQGQATLRRVPSWSRVAIDVQPDELPITVQLKNTNRSLMTRNDRAYRLDFTPQIEVGYSWQLIYQKQPLGLDWQVFTADGQPIQLGRDGFADIDAATRWPLQAQAPWGEKLRCDPPLAAPAATEKVIVGSTTNQSIRALTCEAT